MPDNYEGAYEKHIKKNGGHVNLMHWANLDVAAVNEEFAAETSSAPQAPAPAAGACAMLTQSPEKPDDEHPETHAQRFFAVVEQHTAPKGDSIEVKNRVADIQGDDDEDEETSVYNYLCRIAHKVQMKGGL